MRRQRARSSPPLLTSILFIGFCVLVVVFVTLRQVHTAENHGLRLLAAYAHRIETSVEDLAGRFARIAATAEDATSAASRLDNIQNLSFTSFETGDPSPDGARTPAAITLQAGEGRLFLTYSGSGPEPAAPEARGTSTRVVAARTVGATLELTSIVQPITMTESFDAVLIADREGRVIHGQGEPEIRAISVRSLFATSSDEASRSSDRSATTTRVEEVTLAGRKHRVFAHPLEIDLRARVGEPPEVERWTVVALVASDRLLASGFTASPVLLLSLVGLFPLAILAWPFLKLWLISARQRFTRFDVAFLVTASFCVVFLTTATVQLLGFHFRLGQAVDDDLDALSAAVESSLATEIRAMGEQLKQVGEVGPCWLDEALRDQPGRVGRRDERGNLRRFSDLQRLIDTVPPQGHDSTLHLLPDLGAYPLLASLYWFDDFGRVYSNLPLSQFAVNTGSVAGREYVECALAGNELQLSGDGGTLSVCLQSVLSNTSGRSLAVAARGVAAPTAACTTWDVEEVRGDPKADDGTRGRSHNWGVALTSELFSITQAPLPGAYSLAVTDADGGVVFHSDPSRNLSENLVKSCDGDPGLGSILAGRRRAHIDTRYLGAPHRLAITPLEGVPWSLVVLRDVTDIRQRTVEAVLDALNPFLMLLGLFLLAATALSALGGLRSQQGRRSPSQDLWPDSQKLQIYNVIVVAAPALLGLYAVTLASGHPELLFWASVFFPVGMVMLVVSGIAVWRTRRRMESPSGFWLETWLQKRWGALRKHWSRCLAGLGLVVWIVASFLVLRPQGRGVASFLVLLTVALAIALYRRLEHERFCGEQRRIAYRFAMMCFLVLASGVPALGFLELAISRQTEIFLQAQQIDAAAVSEHRETTVPRARLARWVPDWRSFGSFPTDPPADLEVGAAVEALDGLTSTYFEALGVHRGRPETRSAVSWPWITPWAESLGPSQQDGRLPFVARLVSFRFLSFGDLTRRHTFLDPARYEPRTVTWSLANQRLEGKHLRRQSQGESIVLATDWPFRQSIASLPTRQVVLLGGFLALALLAPWILTVVIAEKILLISLVPIIRSEERFQWLWRRLDRKRPTMLVTSTPDVVEANLVDPTSKSEGSKEKTPSVRMEGLVSAYGELSSKPGDSLEVRGKALLESVGLKNEAKGKLLVVGFWPDLEDSEHAGLQLEVLQCLLACRIGVMVISRLDPRDLLEDPAQGTGPTILRQRWASTLARFTIAHGREVDKSVHTRWKEEVVGKGSKAGEGASRNKEALAAVLADECDSPRRLVAIGDQVVQELTDKRGAAIDLATTSQLVSHVGHLARAYYQAIWDGLTTDERVVLYQLAKDGFTNPRNLIHINDLLLKGLVDRDPELRIMNQSFARFVLDTVNRSTVVGWETEEGPSAWSVLRWLLPLPLLVLGGYLFITQPAAFSNVIGLLLAVGSFLPIFRNLYESLQSVASKSGNGDSNGRGAETAGGDDGSAKE